MCGSGVRIGMMTIHRLRKLIRKGRKAGSYRVIRGGSWGNGPQYCRVAFRSGYTPGYRSYASGFRLAIIFNPLVLLLFFPLERGAWCAAFLGSYA